MSAQDEPEPADARVAAALARVGLLVLDVDGTLTAGGVTYLDDGTELVRFDVRDGHGLVQLRRAGVRIAWITGRGCAATRRRAEELGVERLVERCKDKGAALAALQDEWRIAPDATAAMGDDEPDLALFERAAVRACPADAQPEVRARANFTTRADGGRGAVRELARAILGARAGGEGRG
ncbi:MAG: HAD hydrolase family protein [Planctomycetota bacterium]